MRFLSAAVCLWLLALSAPCHAGEEHLPDPPQVPSWIPARADQDALNREREKLVAEKQDIVEGPKGIKRFNEEIKDGVPEEKEGYYNAWRAELQRRCAEYRQSLARFRSKLRLAVLPALRGAVRQTQDALRRLTPSMQENAAQLAEWQRTTEETVAHAKEMGIELFADALITIPQARLGVLYKKLEGQASSELQRVATLLAGETNPGRREQLHSAFKLLSGQRAAIRKLQALLTNLRQARGVKDLNDLAEMTEEKGKLVEGVLQLMDAVGDEGLQESLKARFGLNFPALTLLGEASALYRYGGKVVEAAYDVTAVSVSWARINQLNRNSEEYLRAVGALHERMKKLVGQIREIEGQPN